MIFLLLFKKISFTLFLMRNSLIETQINNIGKRFMYGEYATLLIKI